MTMIDKEPFAALKQLDNALKEINENTGIKLPTQEELALNDKIHKFNVNITMSYDDIDALMYFIEEYFVKSICQDVAENIPNTDIDYIGCVADVYRNIREARNRIIDNVTKENDLNE